MLAFLVGFAVFMMYFCYFAYFLGWVLAIFWYTIKFIDSSVKKIWEFLTKKQKKSDDLL